MGLCGLVSSYNLLSLNFEEWAWLGWLGLRIRIGLVNLASVNMEVEANCSRSRSLRLDWV